MSERALLTAERARQLLVYEPDTGLLRWREKRGKVMAGDLAGCPKDGYLVVRVDDRLYRVHRIAWLMVHGEWPAAEVDHIDGNRSNNRIGNLRECKDGVVNQHNESRLRRNNRSGYSGVSWSKAMGKWEAALKVDYKRIVVGYFSDPAVAHVARSKAKADMHLASRERRTAYAAG